MFFWNSLKSSISFLGIIRRNNKGTVVYIDKSSTFNELIFKRIGKRFIGAIFSKLNITDIISIIM